MGKFESVKRAMERVWQQVGYDVFAAQPELTAVPRATVIELVLDADRLELMGRADAGELAEFRALTYTQQVAVAEEVFLGTHFQ
jgi:hypothetical protein